VRIAVISDTHLQDAAQAEELLWGHLYGVDAILHAGDVVTEEVIDLLERIAPVYGVAGNMDGPAVRRRWPTERLLEFGRFRIGLTHGSGPPLGLPGRVRRQFATVPEGVDAIVFGHSHQPGIEEQAGVLLINPGSPTDRRYAPYCSYCLLELGTHLTPQLVRLGAPAAAD
jgi:putative phosphoesterase